MLGKQALDVLAPPRPVIQGEHPTDGIDHELGVAGVKVELADEAAVAVGDGEGRLDRSASIWARAAGSCIRQRRTSRVLPGTPAALMTTLSLIGHSRGRLRASSLAALAVPMPSIAVSAPRRTSMRPRVSSPASRKSVSCGMAASIADSRCRPGGKRVLRALGRVA
jgi:hypothetical protein